jgi:hypothetical protein
MTYKNLRLSEDNRREILHFINNIHEILEFLLTCEEIEKIIFLHL